MVRITAPWQASYDPALAVRTGDRVEVEREDNRWPGWWWARDAGGLGGWLPGEVLDPAAAGVALVVAEFDTRELTVAPDQEVSVLHERRGWAWCRDATGGEGWVPLNCLGR